MVIFEVDRFFVGIIFCIPPALMQEIYQDQNKKFQIEFNSKLVLGLRLEKWLELRKGASRL